MRAQHMPQPRQHTMLMRITMTVAMLMLVIFTVTVAVAASAALRVGHACQHAPAHPLRHIDNNQPAAIAKDPQRQRLG